MADDRSDSGRIDNRACARQFLRGIQGQLIGKYATCARLCHTNVSVCYGKYSYRSSPDAEGVNTWFGFGTAHGRSCLQYGKHTRY